MWFSRFKFLDPGPLVDQELTLVAPSEKYLDEVMQAEELIGTPDLEAARLRQEEFLRACPRGHQRKHSPGKVPTYHFWMRIDPRHPGSRGLPITMVGGLNLRIGSNTELEMYTGHIGYGVHAPARGRHYAERACRLLLPLARAHGVNPLIITCNPDNFASRRTCERLGATLLETVDIPLDHPFRDRGETQKCRYRLDL